MAETFLHSRRRAILRATPEILVELCKGSEAHTRVVANALPADARVTSTGIDPFSGGLLIVVESETFAPIEVGEQLPVLTLPLFERMKPT